MKRLLSALFALVVVGCAYNCDKEMDKIRSQYGEPEEVNSYDSGGYHSVSWWYWSKGKEFTFTWSKDKACERSTYTFSPITKPVTDEDRRCVETNKRVVDRETTGNGCPTCP